jgi:hypothetical protein
LRIPKAQIPRQFRLLAAQRQSTALKSRTLAKPSNLLPSASNFLTGHVQEGRHRKEGIAMKRLLLACAVALLALGTLAPAASARGVVVVRPYVGFAYGPGFYPGWYGYYGPWYGPGYYYPPNAGWVQISTKQKGNQIFVDGGLAGVTGQLKKFPLRAGTHTIELRNQAGKTFYQEQINVIAGKKIKIQSDYAG